MNKKYLVIAAHPDDEILGCGASMAKWSKSGSEVNILIMAEGITSRDSYRNVEKNQKKLIELKKIAKEACSILGVNSVRCLDLPDNRMDSIDLIDIVKVIEKYIDKFKPNVLVTHHSGDLNIDHQIIHNAVITASRPQPNHCVSQILAFEVLSATDWQSPSLIKPFVPNWFEAVAETIDLKIKALEIYKTEMRGWPHSRSIKAIKHLAALRGSSVGCEAAESFMLIRNIRL